MSHRPVPGTWVRLTHLGRSSGKWHRVTGWHADRLMLGCSQRDRHLAWALGSLGAFRVERTATQPATDACLHCRPDFPMLVPAFESERVAA